MFLILLLTDFVLYIVICIRYIIYSVLIQSMELKNLYIE
jgi:hypothetical protein